MMLEFIRQNRGPLSAIRVQVAAVSAEECGAIPWDEFQVKEIDSFNELFTFITQLSKSKRQSFETILKIYQV